MVNNSNKRSASDRKGPSLYPTYNAQAHRSNSFRHATGSVNMRQAAQALAAAAAPSTARTGGYSFSAQGGKELNFKDTAISGTESTTARVVLLNGMAQGTTASERVGRRITIKSVELKARLSPGTAGTLATVRYALVLDRQANAATANFTDIYDAALPESLRNISNKARFQVVWDSGLLPVIGNSTTLLTDDSRHSIEFYKKVGIPVQYNAVNGGAIGDIQTNALYFVSVGDVVTGTTAPVMVGQARIRYADL